MNRSRLRPGFCTLTAIIPTAVRRRLRTESSGNVSALVSRILADGLGMSESELPPRPHRGRTARDSNGKPKPWTAAELARLGTIADEILAHQLNRTVSAVTHMRKWKGILTVAGKKRRATKAKAKGER